MRKITQRSVHWKADMITLGALDTDCYASGLNRNRQVNNAVRLFLELKIAWQRGMACQDIRKAQILQAQILERWNKMFYERVI